MRVWLLCGMLAVQAAWADALRVDALHLTAAAPWQRGAAAEEQEDDVYLLEWPLSGQAPDIALQVVVPRQATPVKTDAATFLAQLREKWRLRYGRAAVVTELEIGAIRWLACRRPSGDGSATLFQLVSVHEGRAYNLLAFAAPQAAGLPQPIHDLLAGVDFAAPPPAWKVSRVVAAQPGGEALAALVQLDAERLGEQGMVTGYGVEYRPLSDAVRAGLGLNWFFDGFRWAHKAGREQREPFALHGQLEARLPARTSGALELVLQQAGESNAGVEVEISRLDLCAPAAALDDALARLEQGARAPLERLLRERPSTCPAAATTSPVLVPLRPGQAVTHTLTLAAPPPADLVRYEVVALRLRLPGGEDEPGQGLLRPLGLYFVYAP